MTPSEVLKTLADEAISELSALQDHPVYNASGNHDATHRPADITGMRAILAVSKATTVLRLVSMLVVDEPPTPGTDLVLHRDSKGRFASTTGDS